MDDRSARIEDGVGDPLPAPGSGPDGDRFSEAMQQQQSRREQLRYVREFLNNPLFVDLSENTFDSSSAADEIDSRKQDLRYRVSVLNALLTIFSDELEMLDRLEPPDG